MKEEKHCVLFYKPQGIIDEDESYLKEEGFFSKIWFRRNLRRWYSWAEQLPLRTDHTIRA